MQLCLTGQVVLPNSNNTLALLDCFACLGCFGVPDPTILLTELPGIKPEILFHLHVGILHMATTTWKVFLKA